MLLAFGQLAVGRPLAGYDVTNYSGPNRLQVTEAIRSGRLPQWDPFRFGGSPLLANPQAAVLYPFHWALAAVPADRAQGVSLTFHAIVLAGGAYAFARRALEVSPPAALVAGVGVALGGFSHAHAGHYEQATAMAWFPWALLGAHLAASSSKTARASRWSPAGVALCLALVALAGHTQYLHMVLAAVAIYAVATVRTWLGVARLVSGAVLGLGIAAAQLVPTALVARQSIRAGGLTIAEAAQESVAPAQVLSVFLSDDWGRMSVEAWAWVPWAVAALAVIGVTTGTRDRRVLGLGLLVATGVALALGRHAPLYRLAFDVVPGLDLFRVPSRWLLLPAMAIPMLAGLGLDAIRDQRSLRRGATLSAAVVVLAVAAGLLTQTGGPTPAGAAAGAAIVAVVAAAWAIAGRPRTGGGPGRSLVAPACVVVVVGVVVGEAAVANSDAYIRWLRMEPEALFRRSTTLDVLGGDVSGRILSVGADDLGDFDGQRRAERPNAHVFDHLRSVDGYDGGLLVTRRWRTAMLALAGETNAVSFDTLRGVIGPRRLDETRFVELDITRVVERGAWFDPLDVLPAGSTRLQQVGDVRLYHTPSLGSVFLRDHTVPEGLRLRRDVRRPEVLVVEVPPTAGGATVVVSEAFDDGWRASPALSLRRHHDLLLSFTAPPGGGRVTLRYRTPGLSAGAGITMLSLAGVTALVAYRPRRSNAPLASGRP